MAQGFKVIVVGGSIAGLTLAHCLERLGINYELLEKSSQVSPQMGASVGILPNGARILDQLGLFDAMEAEIEPMTLSRIRYPDNGGFESHYPTVLESAFGYPVSFLERRMLLAILYENLRHKKRVHLSSKVTSLEQGTSTVTVKTESGDRYSGHLVVGADGVHSIVRSEVQRRLRAVSRADAALRTESEESNLKVQYSCIYGMSMVPGLQGGLQTSLLDYRVTIHFFQGKQGKFFWFVVVKNEGSGPHDFSAEAGHRICESLRGKKLSSTLTFGDIWCRRTMCIMTPLEEGFFTRWSSGRLMCIGDAVRKVAPNSGQGANMAIEDATALANALHGSDLDALMQTETEMDRLMRQINTAQLDRTRNMCAHSAFVVRMQSHNDCALYLLSRYVVPAFRDIPAALAADTIKDACLLNFLERPERARREVPCLNLVALLPRAHLLVALLGVAAVILGWYAAASR
ncbi:hypothetical protein PG988_015908 [Apiospora saccharicola]